MTEEPDQILSQAHSLIPAAINNAQSATGHQTRWKNIIFKLEKFPSCLSNLSSHPFFSKNSLFCEQIQSLCSTLQHCIILSAGRIVGKLQMQSELDSLSAKLDQILHDCNHLIKTGVFSNITAPPEQFRIHELLTRLQIGHPEAKHQAIEALVDAISEDKNDVFMLLNRTNISALVHLLAAPSIRTREKAVVVVCTLIQSGKFDNSLVSEGVIPLLVRLVECGTLLCKEKAVAALERLSMSQDAARCVAEQSGGVRSLVEVCRGGDSIARSAAAAALKNLSAVPEVRQNLADEGVVKLMINFLDFEMLMGAKEQAAECLQNLTSNNESLRRAVVSDGGICSILAYLDGPLPQEPAVNTLKNLICSASAESIISLGVVPRLVHVLKDGSVGARRAAAATICRISSSIEVKKMLGEFGCVKLLVELMEAKENGAREAAAQALANLMSFAQNCREVKKGEKSVPNLVQLLDPCLDNRAKKYAVSCLLYLSSSKTCKKLMCSYGAIGYLKKLSEMEVIGAKKLLERLEKGKMRRFFGRK